MDYQFIKEVLVTVIVFIGSFWVLFHKLRQFMDADEPADVAEQVASVAANDGMASAYPQGCAVDTVQNSKLI